MAVYHPVRRAKKNGGKWIQAMHIKKGSFTATKKRTGKSTEELTHSKSSKTRKRAVLAQTLAKLRKKKK